jgi:hypothetical protein
MIMVNPNKSRVRAADTRLWQNFIQRRTVHQTWMPDGIDPVVRGRIRYSLYIILKC